MVDTAERGAPGRFRYPIPAVGATRRWRERGACGAGEESAQLWLRPWVALPVGAG